MWLEVANALVLTFAISEVQLRQSTWRAQAFVLGPWLGFHILLWAWDRLFASESTGDGAVEGTEGDKTARVPQWHRVSGFIGTDILLTAIVSLGLFAAGSAVLVRRGWSLEGQRTKRAACLCLAGIPGLVYWFVSHWRLVDAAAHTTLFKHAVAIVAFAALTVIDVRRHRPETTVVACGRLLLEALPLFLMLFPAVAILLGLVLLLVGGLSDNLGAGHAWLNMPTYFAIVYAPWSLLYFLVKRASLAQKRATILP